MAKHNEEILTKKKQSLAGKKSWIKRKENEGHRVQIHRGHKASRTRYSSELGYMDELAKAKGLKKSNVFHHEGLPDLMAVTASGKLIFCEIKPKKGRKQRTLLNPQQLQAIKSLLKQDCVEEVNLVRYTSNKGILAYDEPIKLTAQNVRKFTYK